MVSKTKILLVDGCDRQTLPLVKAYKKMNCHITTLNGSKLDNGYVSRYPDRKLLYKEIHNNKSEHIRVIKELLTKEDFDVVITTSDDTAEGLTLMKDSVKNGKSISVVDKDLFYTAYNKNNTMKVCMDNEIPCPKTYFGINSVDELLNTGIQFPIVIKPCMSFGAIGFHKIDNVDDLKKVFFETETDLASYVVQEYIPQTDIQYECAMFIDSNNCVKSSCVFSKNRWFPINGGSSTCNVTVERQDIVESCTKLLQTIGWRGAADIDLIQDPRDGVAKIMEINPRVSGSVKVVLKSGVNIAQQIVELTTGKEVSSFIEYKKDVRMRCSHTDLLWFIKSPKRFKTYPSWFSWKNTSDQIFDITDPIPYFTFSVDAVRKYRGEMRKRS